MATRRRSRVKPVPLPAPEESEDPLPGPGGDGAIPPSLTKEPPTAVKGTSDTPVKGTSDDIKPEDGSPSKPTEEQACPVESAHKIVEADTVTLQEKAKTGESANVMVAKMDESEVVPLTREGTSDCNPEEVSETPDKGDNEEMLTSRVLEEEKKAEKEEEVEAEKETAELKKRRELWTQMDRETKEMRYKRLQLLLMKSNMYTEYLMKRMERQKEEEMKKHERLQKKEVKKKLKEQQEQQIDDGKDNAKTSATEKINDQAEVDGKENRTQLATDAEQVTGVTSPRPRSKLSLRAPVSKSALSSPNAQSPGTRSLAGTPEMGSEGSQEDLSGRRSSRVKLKTPDVTDSTSNRGRKRKLQEEVKSPKSGQLISNFFQKDGKKTKLENADDEDRTKGSLGVPAGVSRVQEMPVTGMKMPVTGMKRLPLVAEVKEDGTITRPALFDGGTLRQYQVEGLNWLKVLFENGVNGILADEMGLGKTIQVIALITQIVTMGAAGPFMIVAPLSTLPNWRDEFKRFASLLPVVFYHGAKDDRGSIRRQIHRQYRVDQYKIRPVVITSYDMALIDRQYLMHIDWTYIIVDEGHRLKNMECRLIKHLKMYNTAHRLLLTGTPLQNNLKELWSLLNFLVPEIFDDLGSFETWFDVEVISDDGANEAIIQQEKKSNILGMLHQILTPFMLRRVKSDVDLKIPPKKELLVYAPLTKVQDEFYRHTVDRTILKKIEEAENKVEPVEVSESGRVKRRSVKKVDYSLMIESKKDSETPVNKKRDEEELEAWVAAVMEQSKTLPREEVKKQSQINIRMQNIMMQLRKCCNHPYLLQYPLDEDGEFKVDENLVTVCGKMIILDRLLAELKKKGHKVLLFSQMTQMLNIIEDFCIMRKYQYCRLDGSTGIAERQEGMTKFNTDAKMFLYLLSTRAGGLGINLTSADTVIIYDSDWNPQNDLQAQDRCHRIGQTRPVMIYRLVTANTIDQKIVERAASKRKLEKMVIQKGKFKSGIQNFSRENKPMCPEELLELLNAKDHSGAVRKGKLDCVLSQEDLEALLDRRDMWQDYQKLLDGKKDDKPGKRESVLRTSSRESSKLFKMIDYDDGGSTLDKEGSGKVAGQLVDTEASAKVSGQSGDTEGPAKVTDQKGDSGINTNVKPKSDQTNGEEMETV